MIKPSALKKRFYRTDLPVPPFTQGKIRATDIPTSVLFVNLAMP
jgi:hypothetical protein